MRACVYHDGKGERRQETEEGGGNSDRQQWPRSCVVCPRVGRERGAGERKRKKNQATGPKIVGGLGCLLLFRVVSFTCRVFRL